MSKPVLSDVSVIIPTLGRPLLRDAMQSIVDGTAWPALLVVLDQSSSSAVATWVAELRARGMAAEHIPSTQRGVAAARNRALERLRTRFVAVNDDDQLVEPEWLERMVAHLRAHPDVIVTGRVMPERDGVPSVKTSPDSATYTRPSLVSDPLYAGNMGCALATIARIGPFDEDPLLRSAEDCEWCYRALRAGVPIVYNPAVGVLHRDWRDPAQLAATYRNYARSQGGFYGKYLRRRDWFIALRASADVARGLRRWIRGVVGQDTQRAAMGRAFVVDLMRGIGTGLAARSPAR